MSAEVDALRRALEAQGKRIADLELEVAQLKCQVVFDHAVRGINIHFDPTVAVPGDERPKAGEAPPV